MSNTYRIRTQVGVDKSIKLLLDQDFEQLEILSLKILSSQVYNRQCSDYGVIIGRISANNGLGLPNCKVSLFIPLSSQDEENPVISTLYPYKSLSDVNEDGYRYNLLPYTKSYSAHVPTGSFPDREDALIDTNVIEVYDKYYKFTTQTNDSGDYMIFGVPLGSQTIHVDIDLSDIGEFSLSPQDLIREGVATESQVAGASFRSSSNLNSLPQIISFNRTINVDPFWGETDVCSIGITRTDFDITEESNVNITPTAIFMGSIISSGDDQSQKNNCKIKPKQGELCSLVTGPGEILAIRQTIQQDNQGRPILEVFELDSGGQVIDDNGTWLIDVPMNLDYVFTNEFGERVISNDPSVGIPTRGKYRFKIKWNQSPKLSEPIKRAYFLVPNIREYGWTSNGLDPGVSNPNVYKSYAFSLDWDEYVDPQAAIDCEDYFYLMSFNKVYTVTQLIDQYKRGYLPNRTISIKNILDDVCESENVKFPTNDAAYRFDSQYLLFIILLYIARPILYILLIVSHLLAGLLFVITFGTLWRRIANLRLPNLSYPDCDLCNCNEGGEATGPGPTAFQTAVDAELNQQGYLTPLWSFSQYTRPSGLWQEESWCPSVPGTAINFQPYDEISNPNGAGCGPFATICNPNDPNYLTFSEQLLLTGKPYNPGLPSPGTFVPQMQDLQNGRKIFTTSIPIFERLNLFNLKSAYYDGYIPRLYEIPAGSSFGGNWYPENNTVNVRNSYNPWGGGNRIRVSFRPTLNGYPDWTDPSYPFTYYDAWDSGYNKKYHFDSVTVLMVKPEKLGEFTPGKLVTFQNPELSSDTNLTGNTTNQFSGTATTGITINTGTTNIDVTWANFDGNGNSVTSYLINQGVDDAQFNRYPMDIEYFQVITAATISDLYGNMFNLNDDYIDPDYLSQFDRNYPTVGRSAPNYPGTLHHALFTRTNIVTMKTDNQFVRNNFCRGSRDDFFDMGTYRVSPALAFNNFENQVLVFLVRGVDPYSTRGEVEYDLSGVINPVLSPIYGRSPNPPGTGNRPNYFDCDPNNYPGCINSDPRYVVRGNNYKLNIPINGGIKNTKHNNNVDGYDPDSNQYLYYPSYHYKPTVGGTSSFISFTSGLPKYYSQLDKSTTYDYLDNARGVDDVTNNSQTSTNPPYLKLDSDVSHNNGSGLWEPPDDTEQLRNAFQVEFRRIRDLDSSGLRRPILNGDQDYRGVFKHKSPNIYYRSYWSNQIVEGGTFMNQVLCLNGGPGRCTLGPDLDPNDNRPKGVSYYYAPSYLLYNLTYDYTNTMASQGRIVMRSDRLPISTSYIQDLQNVYPLFSNPKFTVYTITEEDDGSGGVGGFGSNTSAPLNTPNFNDIAQTFEDIPEGLNILETFTCSMLVPLDCYQPNGDEISVVTPPSDCYENGVTDAFVMENGCYVLITAPILSIIKDFKLLSEWTNRLQITYAACRNVWSHMFTNNWINGTLYAFSFKNDTFFDGNNNPVRKYCKDTIILHPTNNYYYRSSPYYSGTTSILPRFVGSPPNNVDYGGNSRNLKFPTTIVDLGPRNDFTQELVYTNEYDGYIMNRLSETTYKDVSEILNLLIVNRLTNNSFIQDMLGGGGANALAYFNGRTSDGDKRFVDGDYAQMISISSELGVVEFESDNYPPIPSGQYPIYFVSTQSDDPVFGIFFSSDSQTRDYLSPKRLIINPLASPNSNCAFSNFFVYSQEVPFYQWSINNNENSPSSPYNNIFGSQSNNWYTSTLGNSFLSKPYQSMDRLDSSSRYFRSTSSFSRDSKGYIYSYDDINDEYNPSRSSWATNSPIPSAITVGAPFHFYFGLKKGKTAWDRFIKKWINFENITE